MVPFGKKATYIAPGKIGLTRGQVFRAPFLPGVSSKENHSASNDASHMSNANDEPINKAPRKEVNPLHTSLIESLNEDVHEDHMLQRLINNDALSRFIDESASEGDPRMYEEATNVTAVNVTQKRNCQSDARPRSVNKCKKVANSKLGEKLQVEFYNCGLVGENHKDLIMHMGKLVRDCIIFPVRVHSWDEIKPKAMEHMWQSVLDEIFAVENDYPSISTFKVVKKCFGDQDRGSIVCFGSAVRPKYVRGPLPSRFELTTRLYEKEKENDDLKK
ncbi:ATP-dependent RNA helicase dbp4 [Bienertia sinuspersici]